jgi:hypothetical protein
MMGVELLLFDSSRLYLNEFHLTAQGQPLPLEGT